MGITKTEIFTEEQNKMAVMLKALAHPARIAILQRIMIVNTCICGDFVGELGLAQSTISQHLRELKEAGIIQGSIEGASICYCINPDVWKPLQREIWDFFAEYKGSIPCC